MPQPHTTIGGLDPGPDRMRIRRARIAVAGVFAAHGAVSGSFVSRLPSLQERLELSTAQLGIALAFPMAGAALAMPVAGRIIHRYGGRAATRVLITLFCTTLVLTPFAPSVAVLCLALAFSGAAAGTADVAMNAEGVEAERRHGRSIMSSLHGLWGVGALLGSAAGVAAVHFSVDPRVHLTAAAALLTAAAPLLGRGLPDARPAQEEGAPPRFALPPRSAMVIGAVGMCAVLAEGASMNWSGIYLKNLTGAPESVAVAAYTGFACTMTAARLAGDAVVRRLGPVRAVRGSGLLAAIGGTLVVTASGPAAGIAGFALLGLGIAVVLPLCFAAAGRAGQAPGQAIAGVATVTYLTGLLAPTLIGTLGELTSLRISFAVVAAAGLAMVPAAGVLRTPGRGTVATAPPGHTAPAGSTTG